MTVSWNIQVSGSRETVAAKVSDAIREGARTVEPDGHAALAAVHVASAMDSLIRRLAVSKTEGDNAREIEVSAEGTIDVDGLSDINLTMRALALPIVEEVTEQ